MGTNGLFDAVSKNIADENVGNLSGDWYDASIPAANWNRSFPYQLVLIEEVEGPNGPTYREWAKRPATIIQTGVFTLPIPPRDLSITTPFASALSFTLGGAVEEHSGAPVREINFSGTTGVAPFRRSTVKGDTGSNVIQSVFGGTLGAVESLVQTIDGIAGNSKVNIHEGEGAYKGTGLTTKADSDNAMLFHMTGYYQFHLLRRFLENYAALKMESHYRNLRLGLAIWKDAAVYLVTPQRFTVQRSATKPLEYEYQLSFKAWKRVKLDAPKRAAFDHTPAVRDPGVMGQIAAVFDAANAVFNGMSNIVTAAVGDIANVANIMREGSLFLKTATNAAVTLGDMPLAIRDAVANIYYAAAEDLNAASRQLDGLNDKYKNAESIKKAVVVPPGAAQQQLTQDAPLSSLSLPPSVTAAIAKERERVRSFTRLDFEQRRNELQKFSAQFANAIGAGDPVYNETFGISGATNNNREPSYDEMRVLWALQDAASCFDRLAASTAIDEDKVPSSMEYVAALANNSGIKLQEAVSKFAVPMPYGVTLERLAAQYLGDVNRWHEIAVLNGLRAPYVDEEGFELPLLVNADGNRIVVATDENLFQGQTVWLISDNVPKTKRHIDSITKTSDGNVVITLDGEPDLDKYRVSMNARLHAYLPGTVNSQQLIFIPSSAPADDEGLERLPAGVDYFDNLLEVGGIDLLLTQDGDLAVGADGDVRLAYGMANIIQTARLILTTRRGALLHHPEFGLGVSVGSSSADASASELLKQVEESFTSDPMFRSVSGVSIEKRGGMVNISLNLGISGVNENLPVSFALQP